MTTFLLLLNAPSHLGTAGKLQARSVGSTMAVLGRFVNLRVLLSVITQLSLLSNHLCLRKTDAASLGSDISQVQFEVPFLALQSSPLHGSSLRGWILCDLSITHANSSTAPAFGSTLIYSSGVGRSYTLQGFGVTFGKTATAGNTLLLYNTSANCYLSRHKTCRRIWT